MKTVIVYESMFGNTEQFARAIAKALIDAGDPVTTARVGDVEAADLAGCELLVIGAPTHTFSLSRRSTRADAVRQGAPPSRAAIGVREWLTVLDAGFPSAGDRPLVAVFDTRVEAVRHVPGSAAKRAARVLRTQGFEMLDRPTSFYVGDLKGPPSPGELEQAREWASHLAGLYQGHRSTGARA